MSDLIKLLEKSTLRMGEDGATVAEIHRETGMSETWIRAKLGELHREGRLIVGSKCGISLAGRRTTVPAYRIKPSEDRLNGGDERPNRSFRRKRTA